MLIQATDREGAVARLAGDRVRGFTVRNFCAQDFEEGVQPTVLVNNDDDPAVLVAHAGSNCMILGDMRYYIAALRDMLEGRVEQEGGWPDAATSADWEREGRRYLFINSSPFTAWRAAVTAGFDTNPEDYKHAVAFLWYIEGAPRFGRLVQHPCRIAHGLELFELMRQGIGYDPDGYYVRVCLEHGPSFVCEVDGEPVCWSCTHLNGTMGMIYTPEQHRRKGYAKSLAALQIDTRLASDGIACAHVVDHNVASMGMMAGFGAERWEEALCWRAVYWPGEAPPPPEAA